MFKSSQLSLLIGILVLSGFLLIGQNCAAQSDPCQPDPCPSILNAVPGTCVPIGGGSCTPPSFFSCTCETGYIWEQATNMCVVNPCDPDPCESIENALPGSCVSVGTDDFTCNCETGFGWQDATDTCEGGSYTLRLVPDTGISECYDNTGVVTCPAPGQPFYGQDAQNVTNPMSFAISPDGLTVTDNVTGLVWQREDDNTKRTWGSAISYCEDLILVGHEDWRLPDAYELHGIVDFGREIPAIDATVFPGTNSDWYWSASTSVYNANYGWYLHFGSGYLVWNWKDIACYARCVRGEETSPRSFTNNMDGTITDNTTGLMWQRETDMDLNWEDALAYCEDLILPPSGYSDWRLPDVKELQSLVDITRFGPAIDTDFFPGTTSQYASSSTFVRYLDHFSHVSFTSGAIANGGKADPYDWWVRCVRNGNSGP